jgi:hypothetical protein
MSKSNVQKQLTQWVLKKGAKRSVDVIDDNSELKSKKNCTSDNNSTNVNCPLFSNSFSNTKELSTFPINNEPTATISKNIDITSDIYSVDIGNFLRTSDSLLTDHVKAKIINMDNIPSNDFIYPFTLNIRNGKSVKRSLRKNHFEQYKWLTYSNLKSGLFCKYCVLFIVKGGKYNTITLKKFVTEPLTKFSNLTGEDGDLEVHNNNKYHINAIQIADDFLKTLINPKKDVINLINNERLCQVLENRKRLIPIIQSILFLGRQNIPFRGHREEGNILDDSVSSVNMGNFRELLKYRILGGDSTLENHLTTTHSKTTYIIPVVQNELIENSIYIIYII